MPDNNLIEEYQNEILNLRDTNDALTTERDSLKADNERLAEENKKLGEMNQRYFNRLIAQDEKNHLDLDDEPEETVPTCEEFAHTIKFI